MLRAQLRHREGDDGYDHVRPPAHLRGRRCVVPGGTGGPHGEQPIAAAGLKQTYVFCSTLDDDLIVLLFEPRGGVGGRERLLLGSAGGHERFAVSLVGAPSFTIHSSCAGYINQRRYMFVLLFVRFTSRLLFPPAVDVGGWCGRSPILGMGWAWARGQCRLCASFSAMCMAVVRERESRWKAVGGPTAS